MKILLHAPNKTALSGMVFLGELAQKLNYSVLILSETEYLSEGKLDVIELHRENISPKHNFQILNFGIMLLWIKMFVRKFLKNYIVLDRLIESKKQNRWILRYNQNKRRITSIIESFSPDAVYVYGDRHDGFEPALIDVAKGKRIPVIIPPIVYPSDTERLLRFIKRTEDSLTAHDVTEFKYFKIEYSKQWVHDVSSGRDICYYPLWMVNARMKACVLPENPWSPGGGASDFICVGGDLERDGLLRNGVSPNKICITGRVEDDQIYSNFIMRNEVRSKISAKYFVERNRIILVALPQLFEHNLASENDHWEVQFLICEAAQKMGWNVLISLHPKMDVKKYKTVLKKYNFPIVDERLHEVIVAADIFLVGQGSSTATWAVLCEVPLVIADWYGLSYSMYNWIAGKRVINEVRDLEPTLLELSRNDTLRKMMRAQHREQKHLVSPFDGKCVERVLSVGRVGDDGLFQVKSPRAEGVLGPS